MRSRSHAQKTHSSTVAKQIQQTTIVYAEKEYAFLSEDKKSTYTWLLNIEFVWRIYYITQNNTMQEK